MPAEYLEAMTEDFDKVLDSMKRDLNQVRTGRATPQLLDGVQVSIQSYGTSMPLNQVASITAPDARLLVVNPWDKNTMHDIEKGLMGAGLGLNPSSDGQIIRVPIPALTGERRQEMVKTVRRMAEDGKVRARRVRKEYNEIFKGMESDKEINQDELKRLYGKVQEATDTTVERISDIAGSKEKEVLEV